MTLNSFWIVYEPDMGAPVVRASLAEAQQVARERCVLVGNPVGVYGLTGIARPLEQPVVWELAPAADA